MKLAQLLLLPAYVRLALIQAAEPELEYGGHFDASGLGQEVLESLCPEYQRFALHHQYLNQALFMNPG